MSDLPPGRWSHLLVGHQWPAATALAILAAGASRRHGLGGSFEAYAEHLRLTSHNRLGAQQGATAETARAAFHRGRDHALAVADNSALKKQAYESAHRSVLELRSALCDIAEEGNERIQSVLDSQEPLPVKVGTVAEIVTDAQTAANAKAALHGQEMFSVIQRVLDRTEIDIPARVFAAGHGADLRDAFTSPDPRAIKASVEDMIGEIDTGEKPLVTASPPAQPVTGAAPEATPDEAPVRGVPVVVTPPAPAVAGSSTASVTPQRPKPLPAYGADLPRQAATVSVPPAQEHRGAPVANPQPSAALSQPPVVRRPGSPPQPAATALAGAVATDGSRLRRLLSAVTRQEPRICWAVGELPDGITILVTDLADGWIPPGIDVPAGVTLLQPGERRGDLAALLGPATSAAAYHPGQTVSPEQDPQPLLPSPQARLVSPVDELGWELARATKWRDGLPRLAHTLARVAAARTGVLESELESLGEHLVSAAGAVLNRYPTGAPGSAVGNWQLLAAVQALAKDDAALANYHFAWFRSCETDR
ncbi:MAG: DUF5632 domain-containing protein [Mycobacterium sp.]